MYWSIFSTGWLIKGHLPKCLSQWHAFRNSGLIWLSVQRQADLTPPNVHTHTNISRRTQFNFLTSSIRYVWSSTQTVSEFLWSKTWPAGSFGVHAQSLTVNQQLHWCCSVIKCGLVPPLQPLDFPDGPALPPASPQTYAHRPFSPITAHPAYKTCFFLNRVSECISLRSLRRAS